MSISELKSVDDEPAEERALFDGVQSAFDAYSPNCPFIAIHRTNDEMTRVFSNLSNEQLKALLPPLIADLMAATTVDGTA